MILSGGGPTLAGAPYAAMVFPAALRPDRSANTSSRVLLMLVAQRRKVFSECRLTATSAKRHKLN